MLIIKSSNDLYYKPKSKRITNPTAASAAIYNCFAVAYGGKWRAKNKRLKDKFSVSEKNENSTTKHNSWFIKIALVITIILIVYYYFNKKKQD